MQVLWAKTALLPEGWAHRLRVDIDSDGKITALQADSPPAGKQLDILLPAPGNLHSHSFQRAMAGLTEGRGSDLRDSFWTWRQLMYRFLAALNPEHVESITTFTQMQMLEAGYASSVEFHYLHHRPDGRPYDQLTEMSSRIAAAAAASGIGLTLLPVLYEQGGCDGQPLKGSQLRFGNTPERFGRLIADASVAMKPLPADCCLGIALHSLRAVSPQGLATALAQTAGPIHMHLAEQQAEVDEVELCWGQRPAQWLLNHAPVNERWCLIHCTQLTPAEIQALADTGAVAGLCPLTEASLGDGIFDAVRWLGAGGSFGIGSDSNIRISLTEELRTLEYSQRQRDGARAVLATADRSTGRRLFDAAVRGGAQAAGRASGAIAPGLWADLIALDGTAVDLSGKVEDKILDSWIFAADDRPIRDVWSAGRHVVHGGRHIAHAAITRRYLDTLRQLSNAL